MVKITDIRPYEKNPRHNEGAVEAVAKKRGESKSDFFRNAIDQALLAQA